MSRTVAHVILFAGLVLVSTSGPFVIMAGMDAYAVVLLRTTLGAAGFLALAACTGKLRAPGPHAARLLAGGLLLGAHFLLWVKAFDLTNYASNLLLLVAQPIIAALLAVQLGERATWETWVSLALATVGLALITRGDFALGRRALIGDAMCIGASFAITLFYVVTRDARSTLPIASFMGYVMLAAAALAAPVVGWTHANLRYCARSWAWLGAIVVLTTLGGHGLLNLVARHVKLFTLNVVIVLEPAIAIALGALLFGARITALQLGGGSLLGVAVVVGLLHERR
jgi:drug/metabolite transporter (DMT)-like permease